MTDHIDILLVEDNQSDAELTIRALKKSCSIHGLLHLQNGEEALEYIFAFGKYANRVLVHWPKLILIDLKMPKVNGLEVLNRIKNDNRTKCIPVVMLTSSKEDNDVRDSYNLGVNSYVVKPVSFENFSKTVAEIGAYWMLKNEPSPELKHA